MADDAVRRVFSGAPWEPVAGYCRAIRVGDRIAVSGTAPVEPDGSVTAPGDPYLQARRCLEIGLAALAELGAGAANVVRTRMFVTDIRQWREIARAHGEVFQATPPATSMVQVVALIDPAMLVEIELDAIVSAR